MHMSRYSAVFALATILSAGTAFAQAQQPAPDPAPRPAEPTRQAPEQARPAQPAVAAQAMRAEGELTKVDATAKTIAIKNDKGEELQFKYTDATVVTGSDAKVAGLATMAGTPVTIHYTKIELPGEPAADVASRIEVRKK